MFLHGFMSFAAICAIIACLLIMGSFVLIMMNLQHMITDLEQESEILVYIDEDLTTAEAKSVGSNINMITNVDESIFVSREQALEDYIAQQDDPSIFEGVEADTRGTVPPFLCGISVKRSGLWRRSSRSTVLQRSVPTMKFPMALPQCRVF